MHIQIFIGSLEVSLSRETFHPIIFLNYTKTNILESYIFNTFYLDNQESLKRN
ncbi:hypothetical protein C1646_717272 [Rhizophagus diaphanus]|nr:hypothetical protein C1646_717272 [Rhizophagus diaphanus] [Rhizophagus sp. MUCL 43196]